MSTESAEMTASASFAFGYEVPNHPTVATHRTSIGADSRVAAISALFEELDDDVLRPLVSAKTNEEFRELRYDLFGRYLRLSIALGEFLDKQSVDEDNGIQFFTNTLKNNSSLGWSKDFEAEVLFGVETLARARALVTQIVALERPVKKTAKAKDRRLAKRFSVASFWAQIHLDCLAFALLENCSLAPFLLDEIQVGVQMASIAYAAASQGYELRCGQGPPIDLSDLNWDQDDEILATASSQFGLTLRT